MTLLLPTIDNSHQLVPAMGGLLGAAFFPFGNVHTVNNGKRAGGGLPGCVAMRRRHRP
jgi:hypothetical protein